MVTINKKDITALLLLEEYANLHEAESKIVILENKYQSSFPEFEKKIKEKENFSEYDDYIDWMAYLERIRFINEKIEQIRNGEFQVS